MAYRGIGSRYAVAKADDTGLNPGRWTIAFHAADINVNIPFFECHHIVVNGAPGTTLRLYIDNRQWSAAQRGDINEWDPSQAINLQPGNELFFMYSDLTTDGQPPNATIWLRYDEQLIENKGSIFT